MTLPCGCCEGTQVLTPLPTANRPGLSRLSYRVGTYATFLETMKARLSSSDFPELAGLRTRDQSDPSIALLDAWATVADVLTFYQERIANEGYLQTATERRSILELARLVGYNLRPGVAASVYLAYTLEKNSLTVIAAGERAQSVPSAPGEKLQSFETFEPLSARYEWNAIIPRKTRPTQITSGKAGNAEFIDQIYLKGISTKLKPHDPLLFVFPDVHQTVLRWVKDVEPQKAGNKTLVTLQVSLTPVTFQGAISEVMTRYKNLEAFCVSFDDASAIKAINLLTDLETAKVKLSSKLNEAIRMLSFISSDPINASNAQLQNWIKRLIDALQKIKEEMPQDLATGTSTPSLEATKETKDEKPSNLDKLMGLIDPVSKPPLLQPANSLRLSRDAKQIFDVQRDALPQLLTALKPSIKQDIYSAWANVTVTESQKVEIYALRVKSPPFGNNAPRRQILDEQSKVIGTEEWPIAGSITFGVVLTTISSMIGFAATTAGTTYRATVSINRINQSDDTFSDTRELPPTSSIDFPIGNVTIVELNDASSNPIGYSFTFKTSDLPIAVTRTIEIDFPKNGSQSVQVEGHAQTLIDGQTLLYSTNDGRTITIAYSGDNFVVTDEMPLPPDPQNVVALDAQYDRITPNSWAAILRLDQPGSNNIAYFVTDVQPVSKSDYNLTGRVTQLTLKDSWLDAKDLSLSVLRGTTVYAQSELLTLAEEPIDEDICGKNIELGVLYPELQSGRWVIVSGERTDLPGTSGVMASELVMLAGVQQSPDQNASVDGSQGTSGFHSMLILDKGLAYTYKRDTLTIYANVVKATHGETKSEVLGSGDGSSVFQQFLLRQAPLTYLPKATPSGAEDTLQVRVNGILWHEADGLVDLGPKDRGYVTKTDDASKTTVIFGNGEHGARLPTGTENVTAVYRVGIGQPGNVQAGQIKLLATKPPCVKGVVNPQRASGGADREGPDQGRRNAPLATLALDRLVSTDDYAFFVRTYAGIGKASAAPLSDGHRQLVHLTIAGADDNPIDTTSELFQNLNQALHQFGDPFQPVQVVMRELLLLVISAKIRLLPDYLWENVEPKIRSSLLDAFSFDRRELGQSAFLSEAISVIQQVEGVDYVDMVVFDSVSENATSEDLASLGSPENGLALRPFIEVNVARPNDQTNTDPTKRILPAQLAYLSPNIKDTLILNPVELNK